MFLNRFFGTEVKTNILIKALENGDIKKFEKTLGEIMINMLSHFDLDKEMEKIYQVFMIGLVGFLMGRYEIISNNESGYGRYDLAMIPIKSNEKAYLMEFKISKTEKGMSAKAQEATVNAEKFMKVVRKYTSFEELTPTLLREFVEKIVVHECSYDENGTRRQDIDIYYSFVGKVDLPE